MASPRRARFRRKLAFFKRRTHASSRELCAHDYDAKRRKIIRHTARKKQAAMSKLERVVTVWLVVVLLAIIVWLIMPFLMPWLNREAAPAWVQAIGSVLAILAGIWITERQHTKSLAAHEASQRQLEMHHCNRALLAVYGYYESMRQTVDRLDESHSLEVRHFRLPVRRGSWVVPMDQDSLAFLVARGGQDVLNLFSQVHVRALEWHMLIDSFFEFTEKKVDSILETRSAELGRQLRAGELAALVGILIENELKLRASDLDRVTLANARFVDDAIEKLRQRIRELYPHIALPSDI